MALMEIPGHDRDAIEAYEQSIIDAIVRELDAIEVDDTYEPAMGPADSIALHDARAVLDELAYEQWLADGRIAAAG